MCNRYQTAKDIERLRTLFGNAPDEWFENTDKKYDTVYPKSNVPVYLRVNGDELFSNFQWGVVPKWAKNQSTILTNTKSEEVLNKPTWKNSFRTRRCLMPAVAFYEPATVDGKKFQVKFELDSGEPFSFAALWQKTDMFGPPRNCCSLLTCEPNKIVGQIHGRMPVILKPEHYDTYLNTPPEQVEDLLDILLPYESDEMHGNFDPAST